MQRHLVLTSAPNPTEHMLPPCLGCRTVQGSAAEGSREAEALRLPFRQAEAVPKADAAFVQRLMGLSGSDER